MRLGSKAVADRRPWVTGLPACLARWRADRWKQPQTTSTLDPPLNMAPIQAKRTGQRPRILPPTSLSNATQPMRMSRSGCRPRRLLIVILADPDADEPEVRYPSGRMQRQTPMSSASSSELGPLIRKLRSISDLTDQEQRAIADLPVITRILKARREIVRTRDRPVQCCVVLDGWICRYVMLRGMRRQIVSFHIPGDVP